MKIPIALQLYSVRGDSAKDFLGVLDKVAKMGYDGVEFAGYNGHDPKELKKKLDDLGLKAEGTHTSIDQFDDDKFDLTVELHKTLDCPWAIVPWLPEELRNTPDACKATAERLTKITEKLRPLGLKTGFHCHHADMLPLSGGKPAWDLLAANTPKDFIMQYDTSNGMAGGADPVQPILDWPGRGLSVHLKGRTKDGRDVVVGEGDINWKQVFEACETVGGTQWYVVEHEDEGEPPIQAVERCIKNLRELGK